MRVLRESGSGFGIYSLLGEWRCRGGREDVCDVCMRQSLLKIGVVGFCFRPEDTPFPNSNFQTRWLILYLYVILYRANL